MWNVSETDGDNPTRGLLVSFHELLTLTPAPDSPEHYRSGWHRRGPDHGWERSQNSLEIQTRPCPTCGEVTTNASGFFCARCHFTGWWWT